MKKVYLGLLVLALCFVFVGFAAAQNLTAEWKKSKHGNRELAVLDATWEGRKEAAAHCVVDATANKGLRRGCRNC